MAEGTEAPSGSVDPTLRNSEMRTSVWNDISLWVWKWVPSGDIRAMVYLSHGIGEYMGRYEKLCDVLTENGILVEGHDHVGHGKSGGERVYIEDFNVYVQDVIKHVQDMKTANPGVPCFLMGHSMGGLVASLVAIEAKDLFDGVILSAAALELDPQTAGTLIKLAAKVLAVFAPRFGLKAVDTAQISSIPEEVEMYVNDELVYHGALKAKWASEMINAVALGRQKIGEIKCPTLLTHGTNDHLVPFSSTEFVFNNIGSEDKKFEVFEGDYHEVLHDIDQERARVLIKDWIIAHM